MILATLTTPPASVELVAGMPIRDPPTHTGQWNLGDKQQGYRTQPFLLSRRFSVQG